MCFAIPAWETQAKHHFLEQISNSHAAALKFDNIYMLWILIEQSVQSSRAVLAL